jgi:hypothetical protein
MVYEWDEKRAKRAYWTRFGLSAAAAAAGLCLSAWLAAALDLGGL